MQNKRADFIIYSFYLFLYCNVNSKTFTRNTNTISKLQNTTKSCGRYRLVIHLFVAFIQSRLSLLRLGAEQLHFLLVHRDLTAARHLSKEAAKPKVYSID